jgi:hypothetical protein
MGSNLTRKPSLHRLFRKSTFILILVMLVLGIIGIMPGGQVSLAAPQATTWYVDGATGSDLNDCFTPATACETINAAIGLAVAGDTIQVAAGVYLESIDLAQGLLVVGASPLNTILDGGDSQRVVQVGAAAAVTISNLAIRNGFSNTYGGGISNQSDLTLQNVLVTENISTNGGGGIFNNGTLTLVDSQVMNNSSPSVGGGILVWYSGVTTISNSRISANTADQGGGIYSLGTTSVLNSTLVGNIAPTFGGGLAMFSGSAILDGVTVSGNSSDGYAAGVLNNLGTLSITNSTISGNTAPTYTGLANISSDATTDVLNSTIADNLVTGSGTRYGGVANINDAVISFENTLIAGNPDQNCLASGSWTSLGNNLSSDASCEFTESSDLPNTDPLLAPLGDYGGATFTQALLVGSPAIDAGNNSACPPTDQRGVVRPQDGDGVGTNLCDIGAYEVRSQLVVSDVSVTEGNSGSTLAGFLVSLAPASAVTVTVDYSTADATALSGSDYTATTGTLTFTPGQTSQTVNVPVLGDGDDEPDETFSLNLSSAANADLVDSQGVGTILDDDGLSSLTIGDVQVTEGNTGSVTAEFSVHLSPASVDTVSVDFASLAGTAASGVDFTPLNGTLTFTPGQTTQVISVNVTGDVIDEGDSETLTIQLSNATNANLADDSATGTILDDDLARVALGAPVTVIEGDSGQTPAVFEVTLTTPAAFTVTVDYAASSGTGGVFATPDEDFLPVSGSLTFLPGVTAQTFTVMVLGDILIEEDEYFSVQLSNADPVSIYTSTSSGYIQDDDAYRLALPLVVH